MAACKAKKSVTRKFDPTPNQVRTEVDPDRFYDQAPSWNFGTCDTEYCQFDQDHIDQLFWDELLPRMQNLESQSWSEILVKASKQNHPIKVHDLNSVAQRRLADKMIEAESIISLRVTGTHRMYGYMVGSVFNLLWVDLNHGDNDKCVCRSMKKHT